MFKYDNPIIEVIGKIVDVILLGIIWFIMCIPILTIGASTTAAYYVAFGLANNKDGYVVRDFFSSFIQNFKQATVVFLVLGLFASITGINIYLLNTGVIVVSGIVATSIIIAQLCVIIEIMLTALFAFSLLSKFTFNTKQLFITAFQLGNKHLFTCILNYLVVCLLAVLVIISPILVMASAGVYIFLSALLLKRVFIKYRPEAFENLNIVENDDFTFKIKENSYSISEDEDATR